ncbi:MAG TPA: hypothetical protein VFP60_01515 [Pseudolabrys sp.]|nr:hypothetical protein [Pseudolabrys sp.]
MAKLAFAPLDSLLDLACRDGVDVRPTLLRVLTDLYVQKTNHTPDEEKQYVELALALIENVDQQTRLSVKDALAAYPEAPSALLERLAQMPSPRAGHDLPPEAESLVELFFSASAEERRLILTNLDIVSETRRPLPPDSELVRRLENAALRRDPAEFARILERVLGISRALADRITRDDSGEPLVAAAKALGIASDVFQRILLFLNPAIGQSVERFFESCRLFEDLKPAAAERMAAIWRAAAPRARPVHEPVFWEESSRAMPRPGTHSQPRVAKPERHATRSLRS